MRGVLVWWGRRGRRRVFDPVPALCSPLRTCYGSPVASSPSLSPERDGVRVGVVEVVLLALSLERARQFVKAFGERGGNLHVT